MIRLALRSSKAIYNLIHPPSGFTQNKCLPYKKQHAVRGKYKVPLHAMKVQQAR
jgi:hypothetical protein